MGWEPSGMGREPTEDPPVSFCAEHARSRHHRTGLAVDAGAARSAPEHASLVRNNVVGQVVHWSCRGSPSRPSGDGEGWTNQPTTACPQRTATDRLLRRNPNRTSSALAASRSPRSSRTPRPVRPPGHSLPSFLLSRLTSLIFSSQRQPSSAVRARPSFASPAAARLVLRRAARSAVRTEAGAIDDDLT
jgi:hypothetical protein